MLFLNSPTFSTIKQICWNFPTLWFMDLKNNSNLSHKITESINGIWLNITLLLQNVKSPMPYVENYGTIRLFILILNAVTKSSIFQDIRMAGIGVVIRDSEGEVIATLSGRIILPPSMEDVEAMACWQAMHFALEIGIQDVVFEGDSEVIFKHLTSDSRVLGCLW